MEFETETRLTNNWQSNSVAFTNWLGNRENLLEPGLLPQPTIKVLAFLALLDSNKALTYEDLKDIIRKKNVINGILPDNTLRTSVLNLGKTLDRFNHPLELKSFRGLFQLIKRKAIISDIQSDPVVLILNPPATRAEEVAHVLIEKAILPVQGLYFLEWSARWWETYSGKEAEARIKYETGAWDRLGIRDRLLETENKQVIGMVALAPGEGLGEIQFLKKILSDTNQTIHYLAIDSSQKLIRDHIGLLQEILTPEILSGQLICAGVVADIFTSLRYAQDKARNEFKNRGIFKTIQEFLPISCPMLVTYFGNCLGNNYPDQETEFFAMIQSIFQNRPLEILTGVSVMRSTPDEYIRNWDDFLLQTPKHLLETRKLLVSTRSSDSNELSEFTLPDDNSKIFRCPSVKPEPYFVRHGIEGQIYRFYYKLSFDLDLAKDLNQISRPLRKGTLILLHSIIKYKMETLVAGIQMSGIFKIKYDSTYHEVVDTANGKREYAVFSVYLGNNNEKNNI